MFLFVLKKRLIQQQNEGTVASLQIYNLWYFYFFNFEHRQNGKTDQNYALQSNVMYSILKQLFIIIIFACLDFFSHLSFCFCMLKLYIKNWEDH